MSYAFEKKDTNRLNLKSCIVGNLVCFVFLMFALGFVYPYVTYGVSCVMFGDEAKGSLIVDKDNKVVGSYIIGQDNSGDDRLFQSRPSANNYNPTASGGTNYAAHHENQIKNIQERALAIKEKYGIEKDIPTDMLTASGSGLDPNITYKNAMVQAPYIAKVNNLAVDKVTALVESEAYREFMSKDKIVNVNKLNVKLLEIIEANK